VLEIHIISNPEHFTMKKPSINTVKHNYQAHNTLNVMSKIVAMNYK